MTRVLAIDTSGPVTSIGVADSGGANFAVSEEGGRRHAEVIDQVMHRVMGHLAGARPEVIVAGVGPGPYSGLRVGIAFAIGLGRAWNVPVVGVCSLDAIAWGESAREGEMIVTNDARRNEIYWAGYLVTVEHGAERIAGPQVMHRDQAHFDVPVISERQVDAAVMAAHVVALIDDDSSVLHVPNADTPEDWAPHGADGSRISIPAGPLLAPRPLYLRTPDITVSSKKGAGNPS